MLFISSFSLTTLTLAPHSSPSEFLFQIKRRGRVIPYPGYHRHQSEAQKLGLKKLAVDIPDRGSCSENIAEFISVFKNPASIMPCFLTIGYGVVYCYHSTCFGANLIIIECSSKFKGLTQLLIQRVDVFSNTLAHPINRKIRNFNNFQCIKKKLPYSCKKKLNFMKDIRRYVSYLYFDKFKKIFCDHQSLVKDPFIQCLAVFCPFVSRNDVFLNFLIVAPESCENLA